MGCQNRRKETLQRLEYKTLDAKFLHEIQQGLNCSPFEARAVLQVVKEVYIPFADQDAARASPGKITLMAVSAEEPAGKPVGDCQKQTVFLTLHRGPDDDRLFYEHGAAAPIENPLLIIRKELTAPSCSCAQREEGRANPTREAWGEYSPGVGHAPSDGGPVRRPLCRPTTCQPAPLPRACWKPMRQEDP